MIGSLSFLEFAFLFYSFFFILAQFKGR